MPVYWRPIWRTFTSFVVIGAFVALVLVLVWFTRNPESPLVDRARELPVVGGLIGRAQDYYWPPAGGEVEAHEIESIVEYIYRVEPPRPYIWVAEGTPVRSEPDRDADVVATVDAMTNLFVGERAGEWIRVKFRAREGWVLSPQGRRVTYPTGSRPRPVLPLASTRPSDEIGAWAVQSFSSGSEPGSLPPYVVAAEEPIDRLVTECGDAIAGSDAEFGQLYGVEPPGEAREVVFLYSKEADYERFISFAENAVGTAGSAGVGYAATFTEGRSVREVCSTLLHEIAHLLTRRAVGPALPAWLSEGLAVDFALRARDAEPPFKALEERTRRRGRHSFEVLTELDYEEFYPTEDGSLHYAFSGLWVLYLSTDPSLRSGFGEFLRYLADGGPWAEHLAPEDFLEQRESPSLTDDLLHFLATDAATLDAGFNAWLWSRS